MRYLVGLLLLAGCGQALAQDATKPGLRVLNGSTPVGRASTLKCSTGTTCSVAGGVATLTAAGGAGGGYATVADEGTGLAQETTLNFIGAGVSCVDNAGATRTDCTITGGGAGSSPGGVSGNVQVNDGAGGFGAYTGTSCAYAVKTLDASGAATCTAAPTIPADLSAEPFITKTASANLSQEFALGSLATALLVNTTTTGVPTAYAGSTPCSNQFVTALSATGVATCTTDTLASAQHANQGTTTTVLHGNAAGNPSFAAVSLTADVTGTLGIGNGGTAQSTWAANEVLVGTGAATVTRSAIPSCNVAATSKLLYNSATQAFSCGTDQTAAAGSGYATVSDEGTPLAAESTLNFIGAGVTCVDNGVNLTTDCTIPGGGGYATVQEEGSSLTQRSTVNFIGGGVTCVDNAGATKTDCTIPEGYEFLGSTTMGSTAATSATITFSARTYIRFIVWVSGYSNTDIVSLRFGTGAGVDTGQNYSDRNVHMATGGNTFTWTECSSTANTANCGTATNRVRMRLASNAITTARLVTVDCINIAATAKACKIDQMSSSASAANPSVFGNGSGVWANTAAQMTQVQMHANAGNNLNAGSFIQVFGHN